MSKRPIRRATADPERYPSLREHLASRRRFLTVTGAGVASLGLFGACTRGLGSGVGGGDAGTQPDARPQPDAQPPQPDATIDTPGEAPYPDYFTLRIPASGDISAWLIDDGYCTFWVEVATYVEASYLALLEHLSEAAQRCQETLSDYTYDLLNTGTGVAAAEDDLLDALETLVQELNQTEGPTLEAVTLTITYLEDDAPIDGGAPEPSYPE